MPKIETGFLRSRERAPAVFVAYFNQVHLFDCARVEMSQRLINRLRNVYISHTHMDHFIGFDGVLGLMVHSNSPGACVYGPAGIVDSVCCKINAYTWNLEDPSSFFTEVHEIDGERRRVFRLAGNGPVQPEQIDEQPVEDGLIYEAEEYVCRCIPLPHGITSLGYSFEEKPFYNVDKEKLAGTGLRPGPWLRELKERAEAGEWSEMAVEGAVVSVEQQKELLVGNAGTKIVYLTDFVLYPEDIERIAAFARKADTVYCEATYGEEDLELARKNYHLTAGQAGRIAEAAGAGKLVLFHFSPRSDRRALKREARRYFPNVR